MSRTTSTRLSAPAVPRPRRLGAGLALVAVLGLGLTACGDADGDTEAGSTTAAAEVAAPSVSVGDPWVRATEGTEEPSMTAAFMTLDNAGDDDVALVGASSSVAGTVELHEMSMVDGAMAMQEVAGEGIVLTAGRGKVLEPGGYHVMLMDLGEDLAAGDEVDLTLDFSDGSSQDLTVPVREFTEEEGHYHDHSEHSHGDEKSGHGDS